MIRHTVVFSLRHGQGSAAEQTFLADAESLLTSIGGVENFQVSRQVSPKSDLDYQLAMTFADAEAYESYNTHPTHVAFVEQRWLPEVERFQEYDFVAL